MPALEIEGTFRAKMIDRYVSNFASGSIAVIAIFEILEQWIPDPGEWMDWRSEYPGYTVGGMFFVVKTDGTLNRKQVTALQESVGWDGKFSSVEDPTWEPADCQIVIEYEEYRDKGSFRVKWINHWDREPNGGMSKANSDDLSDLDKRFGAQMRAITGPKNAGGAPPNGKPKAGPAKKAAGGPQTHKEIDPDSIPF